MKKLIIASKNDDKIKETKQILNEYTITPMKELGIEIEDSEDENSFEKNAIKKAMLIANKLSGELCIADDSGIEIEYLDGFPGVKTKRWKKGTDRERNLAILKMLDNVPKEKRKVTYTVAIAVTNGKDIICETGKLDGYISTSIRGENGFGFDEIFELEKGKTLAELSGKEKNKVSARKIALEKVKDKLSNM